MSNCEELVANCSKAFREHFTDCKQFAVSCAPGRINIIGEHTDYCGGFVFPAALDFYVVTCATLCDDGKITLYSLDFNESKVFPLNGDRPTDPKGNWENYPLGVIREMMLEGTKLSGVKLALTGNVPHGSGLSSSAAVEVSVATAINHLTKSSFEGPKIATICQKAEHNYAGVHCGIMDQFISACGRKDSAMLLDCRSLEYSHFPLDLGDGCLLIINTNNNRSLASGEYNQRVAECGNALETLQKVHKGKQLRDFTLEDLKSVKTEMSDLCYRRALHVISENERTIKAVEALKNKDLSTLGTLINESHYSLRDNFNVTSAEQDFLQSLAESSTGCCGARMTGAGFGGCLLALFSQKQSAGVFAEMAKKAYMDKFSIEAAFFFKEIGNGARVLSFFDEKQ